MILLNFVVFLFKELCPEEFVHFKNKIVILKVDARKYEESLKAELTGWVKSGHVQEVIITHVLGEAPLCSCPLELCCAVITIFWLSLIFSFHCRIFS